MAFADFEEFSREILRLMPGDSATLTEFDVERLFGRDDIAWGQMEEFARRCGCISIKEPSGAVLVKTATNFAVADSLLSNRSAPTASMQDVNGIFL